MSKNKKPLASERQRLEKLICENLVGEGLKVTYVGSSGSLESKIPIGMKYLLQQSPHPKEVNPDAD